MGNGKNPSGDNSGFREEEREVIPDIGDNYRKPGSVRDVVFKKTNVIVEPSGSNFSYLIFGLEKTAERFGIDYDRCLVLMYLEELGLFGSRIDISGRTVRVSEYQRYGLVVSDYSHNGKELFKLTNRALEILGNIKKVLDDESKFVGANRSTDIATDKKVKSVLSDYFDLHGPL